MKIFRGVGSLFVLGGLALAAFAADPTGTWEWATPAPNGKIETKLKIEAHDGKITGAYSNQFGSTAISNASLAGDVIAFDVVRDLGGKKYIVHYHGKLEGDAIKGTIEAPGHDGGNSVKLDWNAQRVRAEKPADAQPKP